MSETSLDKAIQSLISEHQLATEKLTQEQFAECIKQMIQAGDFVRYSHAYGQAVHYMPFRDKQWLTSRLKDAEGLLRSIQILSGNGDEFKAQINYLITHYFGDDHDD